MAARGIAALHPAGSRPIITRISRWSVFCCPSACIRISTTSTRSAAGPTIWATKSAIRRRACACSRWWRGELAGDVRGRARRIRCSSRCPDTAQRHQLPDRTVRRSDPALSNRIRPSRATGISKSCSSTAAIRRIPVGRLVLGLCGYHDAARQALSDATCTALQLANFWQDVTVDLAEGSRLSSAGPAGEARLFGR